MEQQNKYRIIVSDRTAHMLTAHAAFLAEVSSKAAEKLVVSFQTAVNSLYENPQRCPWLKSENIPSNTYRFLIFEKHYMLVFQIRDNTVYIEYVLDSRRDYGWLIN